MRPQPRVAADGPVPVVARVTQTDGLSKAPTVTKFSGSRLTRCPLSATGFGAVASDVLQGEVACLARTPRSPRRQGQLLSLDKDGNPIPENSKHTKADLLDSTAFRSGSNPSRTDWARKTPAREGPVHRGRDHRAAEAVRSRTGQEPWPTVCSFLNPHDIPCSVS